MSLLRVDCVLLGHNSQVIVVTEIPVNIKIVTPAKRLTYNSTYGAVRLPARNCTQELNKCYFEYIRLCKSRLHHTVIAAYFDSWL